MVQSTSYDEDGERLKIRVGGLLQFGGEMRQGSVVG